jgi:hypothetical protein
MTAGGIKLLLISRPWHNGEVARKAVWQFLKSKNPRIGMLRRAAAAADVPLNELINGPKAKRQK